MHRSRAQKREGGAPGQARRWRVRLALASTTAAACGMLFFAVQRRRLPQLEDAAVAQPVGAWHMHSTLSHDGKLRVDELVQAAQQRHLDFLIVTDHNVPGPPDQVRSGVTLLAAAELSTIWGHVVQLGTAEVPHQTTRQRPDILAQVRQRGGFPVVTHPSDPKRPWRGPLADAAGMEIANLASSARRRFLDSFLAGLGPYLLGYAINPQVALAQLYRSDLRALRQWDEQKRAALVGLCGSDAHGWIDAALNIDAWHVVLHAPLPALPASTTLPSGHAGDSAHPEEQAMQRRAAAIVEQIVTGNFHCVAGLIGHQPDFAFTWRREGAAPLTPARTIAWDAQAALEVRGPRLRSLTPPGRGGAAAAGPVVLVLRRDGQIVARTLSPSLTWPAPAPGCYRAEARLAIPGMLFGHEEMAVILSNRLCISAPPSAPATLPESP